MNHTTLLFVISSMISGEKETLAVLTTKRQERGFLADLCKKGQNAGVSSKRIYTSVIDEL